MKGAVL